MTVVLVTATGTEMGKTWWTAATARALVDRRVPVAVRKPVQSFAPDERGTTDAEILAKATGEAVESVCPPHRWYETPMAPPMAAESLRQPPFTIRELISELAPAPEGAITFVEGAGGPLSPLAGDGDLVDLAEELDPAMVLLVADAGLGTINAVRLCAAVLQRWPLVVALNRLDEASALHVANRAWLERAGFDLVASPDDLAERLVRRHDRTRSPSRPPRADRSRGTR